MQLDGSPARKRFRSQLQANMPRANYILATPMNKIRIQKDQLDAKLRKANVVTKGKQQELTAMHRELNEMQTVIDQLRDENKRYRHQIDFFESNLNGDVKDQMMESQRLNLTVHELEEQMANLTAELTQYKKQNGLEKTLEEERRLREELEHSQTTIDHLNRQIAELRLNIEQQTKITESITKCHS